MGSRRSPQVPPINLAVIGNLLDVGRLLKGMWRVSMMLTPSPLSWIEWSGSQIREIGAILDSDARPESKAEAVKKPAVKRQLGMLLFWHKKRCSGQGGEIKAKILLPFRAPLALGP